jgi:NADH-quinone oxidoreductase subunit J
MATAIFYVLSATALIATVLCVTRRQAVHAIVYLINALFSLALMFYLLGAPLVAAWEVIIYAGAIMVLFLFIVMMFELDPAGEVARPGPARRWPVVLLSGVILACSVALAFADPAGQRGVPGYYASPRAFGELMFGEYALGVEVASFLLLFSAVGAYTVGRCDDEVEGEGGQA